MVELEFQKLSPKPGDVIVVKYPPTLPHVQVTALMRACQIAMTHTGCLVTLLPKGIDVSHQPKQDPPERKGKR